MKRFFQILFGTIAILFFLSFIFGFLGIATMFNPPEERLEKESILALDLDGVIMDGKDFLELLRKYRKEESVKAILVRINSPGGVVGPSQEIHDELKRTREEFKKPVYAYCAAVMASGGYYAAVAADKIYTTPGCMMGSIGVIMEFVNLERLYDWAKIQRYSITTGAFKSAGADYKPLRPEERALFQELLDDVLLQFKGAVSAGRKMDMAKLTQYADGRIFTGAQAVKLGFADATGTWDDARKALGEQAGLGADAKIFAPKKRRGIREFFEEASEAHFTKAAGALLKTELNGKPLFMMPGTVQF
jgi:protease-4